MASQVDQDNRDHAIGFEPVVVLPLSTDRSEHSAAENGDSSITTDPATNNTESRTTTVSQNNDSVPTRRYPVRAKHQQDKFAPYITH